MLEFNCAVLNRHEVHVCESHLEVSRHEGVVYNHHYVFIVFMDQIRAGLDVNNLHHGVSGCLNPHKLHREREGFISW